MKPRTETDRPAPEDKPIAPGTETKTPLKKSHGMTRKGFGELLKRAFTQPAAKPAPKST
jgi:hypothetical protein